MSVKCCGLVLPGNFKLNFATTTCSIKNLMLSEIITMLIQIFSPQYKKVGTGDCLMSDTPADLYCTRFELQSRDAHYWRLDCSLCDLSKVPWCSNSYI